MADVVRSSCCAPMRTVRCKRRGGRTRQLSRTADCWGRLQDELESDHQYKQKHREPYSFIDQMHRKFVKGGGRVEDHQVLDFVTAMCATGEADGTPGSRRARRQRDSPTT